MADVITKNKKYCCRCKDNKSLTDFTKNKSTPDGLEFYCKECRKEYYLPSKAEIAEYQTAYRNAHKPEIAKYRKEYRKTLSGFLRQCYDGIIQRVTNTNCVSYKYYGQRGIENRFTSFTEFYEYVINELGYDNIKKLIGLQINRVNNESHYMRGNINFVTAKENCANRRKGKYPDRSGEAAWAAKLTEKNVRLIRLLYDTTSVFQYQLASQFNVSQSCIRDIVNRNTWRNV